MTALDATAENIRVFVDFKQRPAKLDWRLPFMRWPCQILCQGYAAHRLTN